MPDRTPRILVALTGDISREPHAVVKYGHFIRALENHCEVTLCDATLRGLPRFINAAQVFSFNQQLWKQRFYQNVAGFRKRSRKVAEKIRRAANHVDVVIQIGVLFDASEHSTGIPNIIYSDYTSCLSSRKPSLGRGPQPGSERKHWLALETRAYERAAYNCTRGEFVRQSIIEDYHIDKSRVATIGGGVNFDRLPEKIQRDHAHPTVLFIGKDYYRKGGDLLLKAFNLVRQSVPTARLIMVTNGPIPAGTDLKNVQIVSPTWDRATIQSLYEEADCFVLPSRLETWGDVLLEAMAYGLPCIGVAGDAMNEIIVNGETGLIVPPEDLTALAAAVQSILVNREARERMGAAARQRVEKLFTWDMVVNRLLPIIESTINHQSFLHGGAFERR
jgi:glycosyltransferase involved in cell wall biosynthesis